MNIKFSVFSTPKTIALKLNSVSSSLYVSGNVYGYDGSNEIAFSGIDTSKVVAMECDYDAIGNMEATIEAYAPASIGSTISIRSGNVTIASGTVKSVECVNSRLYRIRISRSVETQDEQRGTETTGGTAGTHDFRRVQGSTAEIEYFLRDAYIDFRVRPLGIFGIKTRTKPVSVDMSFREFADIVYKEFGIELERYQEEEEEEATESLPVDENYTVGQIVSSHYNNLITSQSVIDEREVVVYRTDSGIAASDADVEATPDFGVTVIYEVGKRNPPEATTEERAWIERRNDLGPDAILSCREVTTKLGGIPIRRELTGRHGGQIYRYEIEYVKSGYPDMSSDSIEREAREVLDSVFNIFVWSPTRSFHRAALSEEYTILYDLLGNPHRVLSSRSITATFTQLDSGLLVDSEVSATKIKMLYDWETHETAVTPKYIEYVAQKSEFRWGDALWSGGGSGKGVYVSYRYDNVGDVLNPVIALVSTEMQVLDAKPSPNLPVSDFVFSRRLVTYGNPDNAYEYNATFIEDQATAYECARRIYNQMLHEYLGKQEDTALQIDEWRKVYRIRRMRTELCGVIPVGTRLVSYSASANTRRTVVEYEERVEE